MPSQAIAGDSHYVLVTAARDEAATIGKTIASITRQTILPSQWVIVSDGSTDETETIIRETTRQCPWIQLLVLPSRPGRNFAAVVRSIEHGIHSLTAQEYSFLGLVDADVTFPLDYFERLILEFSKSPRLGLAGGMVVDLGDRRDRLPKNRHEVPGATQFFRREMFESLGGLLAIPEGGWDAITAVMIRMKGYETRLVTDLVVDHHKPRNSSEGGQIRRTWQLGIRDYVLGNHPLFEFVKCVSRIGESPVVIGALSRWIGYCTGVVQQRPRLVPREVVAYIRREQRERLLRMAGVHTGAPP